MHLTGRLSGRRARRATTAEGAPRPRPVAVSVAVALAYLVLYLAALLLGSHLPGTPGAAAWSGLSGLTVALLLLFGLRWAALPLLAGLGAALLLPAETGAVLPPGGTGAVLPPAEAGVALPPAAAGVALPSATAGVALPSAWTRGDLAELALGAVAVTLVWATAAAVLSRLLRLDPALRRPRDVGWFLLVAVGAAPLAAAALRGALAVAGGQLAWRAVPAAVGGSWTAEAVGVLGLAPVVMVLLADRVRPPAPGQPVWRPRLRRPEAAAQALAVAAASLLVLLVPAAQRPPLLCVCFVPVLWVAVRRGVPGAAAGTATLSALAVAVPVLPGGPATDPALAQFESFMVVAAVSGLYIGALAGERAASHHRQHQLSAILDAAPDCVATVDRAGRLLYLNLAGRRLLHLAEDEQVTGRLLRDLLPQLAARLAAQADLGPDLWKGATTMSAAQGRRVPLEHLAVAHLAADGRTEAVSAITRDVSHEQHTGARLAQAEEQLEEHRLHLGAVLARVPIALVVAGVDGTCIRAQGRALERLGPDRPVPGCSLFHAFQGNDQLVGDLCQAAAGSAVSSCTTLGEAVLETHFRPVTGRNGKVRHVIGLLSDVTDRVRAEAVRDDLLTRLDARDAQRRDLDSALRADTAQTLTAWLRHLEILEEQLDSGRPVTALAPVRQTLERVLDSATLPGLDPPPAGGPPAAGGPAGPLPDPAGPEQAVAEADAEPQAGTHAGVQADADAAVQADADPEPEGQTNTAAAADAEADPEVRTNTAAQADADPDPMVAGPVAARPVAAGPDDEGTRALVLAAWGGPGPPPAPAPAAASTGRQLERRPARAIPPASRPDRS